MILLLTIFNLFSIIMASKSKKATTTNSRVAELKTLDRAALLTKLADARKELFVLTMKKDLGELKQTHMIRATRKEIARISTFLSSSL